MNNIRKTVNTVARRTLVRRTGPFIEGDQVDLGRNALNQFHQTVRIFDAVIHAVQHHVFKRNTLGIGNLRIGTQCFQQCFNVPAFVDRHQIIAHFVCRRVEGHCQQTANFFCGARNLWNNARGRQCNTTTRQLNSLRVHRDLHRVAHILKVIQRLAHTH